MAEEKVLVVPRHVFEAVGAFEGLSFETAKFLAALFDPSNNLFLPRSVAEKDPSHKQLIPYAIVRKGDRILHYVRGGGSGEKRLVAKGSIGVGGHLNESDASHIDAADYEALVLRELHEELEIDGPFTNEIVALLNDDSTDVGRVHLGIIHLITVADSAEVKGRDEDVTEMIWLLPGELGLRREKLEGWSKICFDGLEVLLTQKRGPSHERTGW
jgi:predicted NUDIX family phosphoesterase